MVPSSSFHSSELVHVWIVNKCFCIIQKWILTKIITLHISTTEPLVSHWFLPNRVPSGMEKSLSLLYSPFNNFVVLYCIPVLYKSMFKSDVKKITKDVPPIFESIAPSLPCSDICFLFSLFQFPLPLLNTKKLQTKEDSIGIMWETFSIALLIPNKMPI